MKKYFLLAVAFVTSMVASAQVVLVNEDFSKPQASETNDGTQGWYEFINTREGDTRELTTLEGKSCVHFHNAEAEAGASWMRAIKFRNLDIKENSLYRVSFKLQGSNEYYDADLNAVKTNARADLMQGGENCDIAFVDPAGQEQHYDVSHFQEPSEGKGWYEYSHLFFYTNKEAQAKAYTKGELPETYFLTINCYNPGDFFITDVKVEEATMDGIAFKSDVLRVDLGFTVETKGLVAPGMEQYVLPKECVTVTVDGQPAEVESAEIYADGRFFIFLVEPVEEGQAVVVSFKNPGNIYYGAGQALEGLVKDFANVTAKYSEEMDDVYSYLYKTPLVLSVDPEDGSFDLPLDTKTITVTFDKGIDLSKIEATLNGKKLTAAGEGDYPSVVTLTINDAIAPGEATLKIDQVFGELFLDESIYGEYTYTLNFGESTGDVALPEVIFTDGFKEIFEAGNWSESMWTKYNDGALNETNEGTRIINGFSVDFEYGYYCGARNAKGWATIGEREGKPLTLKAGKYKYSMNAAGWQNDDRGVTLTIYEAGNPENVIATQWYELAVNVPGAGKVDNSIKVEFPFTIPAEGNYTILVNPTNKKGEDLGGWAAIVFGNVKIETVPNSAGAVEKNALKEALEAAKKTQETNSAERYVGPAAEALAATIAKYDGQKSTAPSWYKAAIAELGDAADALKKHVALCDEYDPLPLQAVEKRNWRSGSKFEADPMFAKLVEAIAKYTTTVTETDPETLEPVTKEVAVVLYDDAEMEAAIAALKNPIAYMDNIGKVNNLYLASMRSGIASLKKLGADVTEREAQVEALITPDATVAANVRGDLTYAVLKGFAEDITMLDAKVDPETLEESADSLNMSTYLTNNELYCTAWDDKRPEGVAVARPSSDNVPGWTLNKAEGGYDITFHYPWGGAECPAYNAETCPASPAMIASWAWQYEISQDATNLPAGVYTLAVGLYSRNVNPDTDEEKKTYVYVETNEKVIDNETLEEGNLRIEEHYIPGGDGSKEPQGNEVVIPGIVVKDGYLKVGAYIDTPCFLRRFYLYLTKPLEGYDYKTAADGITDVVVPVRFNNTIFNLSGQRVNANAKGIVIINGKKVLRK